jgi:flagellar biosynthesis protein FliQ
MVVRKMSDKKLIVKDVVTENEFVSKFAEFIGKDTFSSLASCATIVGLLVQLVKSITAIPPLALSFIFSAVVSGLKLILSGDYTRQNIVLAVINILPIALTASGGYDVLTNISQ